MKFRLGINYWPAASAMYWWSRFVRSEVEADFARIRSANLDCVRIFLLWEDFQPREGVVDEPSLANLVSVADIAARCELSLIVTLFTGHMSGVNWIPAWALAARGERHARFRIVAGKRVVSAGLRNWYEDQGVAASQALLARSVAQALADHPGLWAYDLGNENSNCMLPPTRDAGRRWLTKLAEAIRAVDRRHPITLGLHMEDLEQDRRLGPHDAATVCDFLSMHAYPMYAWFARSNADPMVVPFLVQLTQWLGNADVLLEEFGAATLPSTDATGSTAAPAPRTPGSIGIVRHPGSTSAALAASDVAAFGAAVDPCRDTGATTGSSARQYDLMPEVEAAHLIAESLSRAEAVGAMGGLVWCYADYAHALWNKPPLDDVAHERHFGAWRADHTAKPVVSALRELSVPQDVSGSAGLEWINIDREHFYDAPADNVRALYRTFLMRNQ